MNGREARRAVSAARGLRSARSQALLPPLVFLALCGSVRSQVEPAAVTCANGDRQRTVELRALASMPEVCDLVVRDDASGTEERTLYHDGEGICAARFRDAVARLGDRGWACEPLSGPSRPALAARRRAAEPLPDSAPDAGRETPRTASSRSAPAVRYRELCLSSIGGGKPREDAEGVCDCTVRTLDRAGWTDADYERLAVSDTERPSTLGTGERDALYLLGAMVLDALAACGVE